MKQETARAWPLRVQLLGMCMMIAMPLIALLGYNLYRSAERDKRELGTAALQLAQVAAQNAESFLADARQILEILAQRPAVLALDPVACDILLGSVPRLNPRFRNALTVNRHGDLVCSTIAPGPETPGRPDPVYWFNPVRDSMQFTIGTPAIGFVSKRWVVTLAYPLRDAHGAFIGAVAVSVDLEDYPLLPTTTALPRGAVAGIASYAGVVIARSSEAGRPVGSSTLQSQVRAAALVTKTGLIEVAGTDAIPRIYAYTPIPGSGWYTVAGIPATDVYAARRARFLQSAALTLVVLLLAVAGAYAAGRRIERPLRAIAATADAVAAGDRAVRAPLAGSRETVVLGGQFNAMLDALDASERQFRETMDDVHLLAVALDERGNVTYCNDFLSELSGWRREELLGRNWFDTVLPDPAPVRVLFEKALGDGSLPLHYENEILTRAGQRRLIHWNNTILRNAAGRILGTVSLGEDITESQRAEQALRDSEQRFKLAASTGNVWDWNFLTNEVSFPSEHWRGLGYDEPGGEFTPAVLESIMHPDDRPRWRQAIKNHISRRLPYDLDFRARTKSGEYRWFNTKGQARWDENGCATYMAGTTFDITERKRAEEALWENKEKLRLFIYYAPSAIAMFDRDMRYIAFSRRWLADYGLEEQELAGRGHYDIFPDLPERWKEIHRRCLAGAIEKCDEDPFPRADGSVDWVRWEAHPWRTGAGEIGGIIIFSEVITERKRVNETLHSYTKQLQDMSRRLLETQETERRSINRELHDRIGQNLSVLNLNLKLIRSGLPKDLPGAATARMDDMQKLLEATTAQVRDVMAELQPPALDDYGLFAALRVYAESFMARANTTITLNGSDLSPPLPPAVEMALFRIVQEALANVAKHARAKRVEVTLAATAETVTLTVSDDGVGFDAAAADPAGPSWGLAIMRERATAAGAVLRLDSAPGRGTRVIIEVARGPA